MVFALLVSLSLRVLLLLNKTFDFDEFQNLHNAWMVSQGFIPYVDFWDNRTPLLMIMLSPFARIFGESVVYLFIGRLVGFCASIAIFVMVFRLARAVGTIYASIFSIFLLSLEMMFLYRTVEVRHDQLTLLTWLLGIWFVVRRGQDSSFRDYGMSGLSVGIGLLFTPKAAFGIASLGLALVLAALVQRPRTKEAGFIGPLAIFAMGAMLPLLVLILGFSLLGGGRALWQQVFVDSIFWPREAIQYSRIGLWLISFKAAPMFWVISLCGLGLTFLRCRQPQSNRDRVGVIVLSVSLVWACAAFFLLLPDVQPHQLMPLIAFLAMFGGRFGGWLLEAIAQQTSPLTRGWLTFGVALILAIGSLQAFANISKALNPLRLANREQLQFIQSILAMTKRSDSILDGSAAYIFRPQASFYGSLVNAVRFRIKSGDLKYDIPERCSTDRCQVVIMDKRLRDMPQATLDFIRRNYAPSAIKGVYLRTSPMSVAKPGLPSPAADAMATSPLTNSLMLSDPIARTGDID